MHHENEYFHNDGYKYLEQLSGEFTMIISKCFLFFLQLILVKEAVKLSNEVMK